MEETSQRIIDAAMELIMERGYSSTTTKDIAERANVNECTIFRKFSGKKELVLQAMKQSRWHPDLRPEDFGERTWNMEEDLVRFSSIYMTKVTPEFVKLSIGLRASELAKDTADGIMAVPQTFKDGLIEYFREMHQRGILKRDDVETLSMMFLSLNFCFIFFKASFGERLTSLTGEEYIRNMTAVFVNGIRE